MRTDGLNGGESPGYVPLDWRLTSTDPASRCIRAIEVDGEQVLRVTEIRHFADGMFAVGEQDNVIGFDGTVNVRMRVANSVRVKWRHKEPCRSCAAWRQDVTLRPREH